MSLEQFLRASTHWSWEWNGRSKVCHNQIFAWQVSVSSHLPDTSCQRLRSLSKASEQVVPKAPFSEVWSHTLPRPATLRNSSNAENRTLWKVRFWSCSVRRRAKYLSIGVLLIWVKKISSGDNSTLEVMLELYTVSKTPALFDKEKGFYSKSMATLRGQHRTFGNFQ